MKKIYITSVLFFAVCACIAQSISRRDETILIPTKNYNSSNPKAPSPAFLSKAVFEKTNCITKAEMQWMQKQIDNNIAVLKKKNPGFEKKTSSVHPLFIWPTQAKAGFTDYGYYTVNYLVDHNSTWNNNLLDYNCGNRTYDWSSGNHAGTDIILWPYAWRRMDEQVMEVIAAAPGIIINKVDGNYDRNCNNNGTGIWNAIHVLHDDNSIAWYLHFKTGSLTTKIVGDSVALGEYLGTAGSSGSSSWPHLHFQVIDANGLLVDPWDGTCNSLNAGDTWWQNQQTYNVPSINRICTKKTQVDYYNCPNPEITFEADTFNLGDSLWLWLYTRDMELNSSMQLNIYNPSNVNVLNFPFTCPWPTIATTYVRWFYVIDPWFVPGWWKFESVYNGNTYSHMFYVSGTNGLGNADFKNTFHLSPNPANEKVEVSGLTFKVDTKLTVFDMVGKEMLNMDASSAKTEIDVSKFKNGIYLVQVKSGNEIGTKKIIIQH